MATRKPATARRAASAGGKGAQPLTVVVPPGIIGAIKSRSDPSRQPERGATITQNPIYPVLDTSIRTLRQHQSVVELIRHLARVEGPFATAVHNIVEVAASKYTILAYDATTHALSVEGTTLAMSIAENMDTPMDYGGSTKKTSIAGTVKTMLREALLTGIVTAELALNKASLPDYIQVVGGETLDWADAGDGGVYPVQTQAGKNEPVSLDIPNFFYAHLNPDPDTVAPRSMMEACLKILVYFEEFMEDIRRSVRVAGHNRMTIELDAEKISKTAPRDVQSDAGKLSSYLNSVRSAVELQLAQISPEQALVHYNTAKPDVLQSGSGTKIDYTPLLNVVAGQYATSMKTPPSVLGLRLEGGSQQMGSVETLIFLKSAKTLHTPVETVMSRILTLAARLYGADVYVWFRMNDLDLRPELELEAFRTMREARLLNHLSLGLITDDEFAVEVGTFPRPPGAVNLSGTMFNHKQAMEVSTSPGDTPMGRDLQPDKDAPRAAGGRSNNR